LKRSRRPRRLRRILVYAVAAAVLVVIGYAGWLSWIVTSTFDARGWDLPAQVYAAPLEIYGGRRLSADDLLVELYRLGYRGIAGQVSFDGAGNNQSPVALAKWK